MRNAFQEKIHTHRMHSVQRPNSTACISALSSGLTSGGASSAGLDPLSVTTAILSENKKRPELL
jgi:hypothetical protein